MLPRLAAVLGLLALTTVGCASRHAPAAMYGQDRDSVLARQADFLAAVSARDLDAALVHFAPDAILHVANMPPIRGAEAIRRFYGNVFQFMRESTTTAEATRVSESADVAYAVGAVRNVFAGEQGQQEFSGKFSLIWEMRKGEWRIVLYSVSNDHPSGGG